MPPEELVTLLDRIFSAFDALADEHGLEKIKTIGDAYMVAGGLPEPRADHADAVARMRPGHARRDRRASRASPASTWLAMRIGIHTGPAVAGVIGRQQVHLRPVGRHRQHRQPHGVARPAGPDPGHRARRARPSATTSTVRPRGTIEVKGKGPMTTYLVER